MKIVKSFFACVVLFPGVLMAWDDNTDKNVPSSDNCEDCDDNDSMSDDSNECCRDSFVRELEGSRD